jgi:hypothetical protein
MNEDVITAARDSGDEKIILMLKEYVKPAITEDEEGGSMFVNLFVGLFSSGLRYGSECFRTPPIDTLGGGGVLHFSRSLVIL